MANQKQKKIGKFPFSWTFGAVPCKMSQSLMIIVANYRELF